MGASDYATNLLMPHSTLAENVADALRQSIYTGSYTSGERLIELMLADEMNVSQNTVRDALRILEQDGLVVKHPRRGVFVRAYTVDEAAEIYELWALIEPLALGWAVTALTEDDLRDLREWVDEARTQAQARNRMGAVEATMAFHETIARIANKRQTTILLNMLHNQIRLLENLRQMRSPRTHIQQYERINVYEQLLSLIEARDTFAAQVVLRDHIHAELHALLPLLDWPAS